MRSVQAWRDEGEAWMGKIEKPIHKERKDDEDQGRSARRVSIERNVSPGLREKERVGYIEGYR